MHYKTRINVFTFSVLKKNNSSYISSQPTNNFLSFVLSPYWNFYGDEAKFISTLKFCLKESLHIMQCLNYI